MRLSWKRLHLLRRRLEPLMMCRPPYRAATDGRENRTVHVAQPRAVEGFRIGVRQADDKQAHGETDPVTTATPYS